MEKTHPRRDVLKTAIAGIAAAALGPRLGFSAGDSELALERLGGSLVRIRGAGGNVVVLPSPEGLLLVDCGAPEHAEALMRFLGEQFEGRPVRALFNTHWHLPHTGANDAVGAGGAKILAHVNTRRWMGTEYYVEWEDRTYSPRAEAALPTETFYSSDPQPISVTFAGHVIEYAHLPEAHTDGDIYVRFPDENVIVAGDVVGADSYPVPDYTTGGWIGGLSEATRRLVELSDAETRIVPGTGPVQSRADLEAQLEMLEAVHERVNSAMIAAKSADDMLAENLTREFDARWGDPRQFIHNIYDGLWWGGRVRGAY